MRVRSGLAFAAIATLLVLVAACSSGDSAPARTPSDGSLSNEA